MNPQEIPGAWVVVLIFWMLVGGAVLGLAISIAMTSLPNAILVFTVGIAAAVWALAR